MASRKHKLDDFPPGRVEKALFLFLQNQGIFNDSSGKIGLLAAVSGGPDSMALLEALHAVSQTETRITVAAAHLIHHPDSNAALERAELVRQFCVQREIPLVSGELKTSPSPGESLEEWMRRERYRFLAETAQEQDCAWILTAHHGDDQAETILHRITAGTGLRGLAGIRPRLGKVLRPFLVLAKEDLLDYCRSRKIPFAEDPSNLDQSRPRNRIRHDILPLLERELNPEVKAALNRLGRWAVEAGEVVEALTAECLEKAVKIFQKGEIVLDIASILPYFYMIQKSALREAICRVAETEVPLQGQDLDRLADFLHHGRTGAHLEFPGGLQVLKDRRELIITAGDIIAVDYNLTPGHDRDLTLLNLKAVWDISPQPPYYSGEDHTADLELTPAAGQLALRNARKGDHFFPLGAPGEKRLFRFLTDRKVSRLDKRRTLVLEQNGRILWVVGHRISQTARIASGGGEPWRLRLVPMSSVGEADYRKRVYGREK